MLDPIGSQVIDYVYAQMKVSEKWSLRQERGFTWWGHTVAQRVWADPPKVGPFSSWHHAPSRLGPLHAVAS